MRDDALTVKAKNKWIRHVKGTFYYRKKRHQIFLTKHSLCIFIT